eukprot:543260-Prorocentrum_minimum.AAC.4
MTVGEYNTWSNTVPAVTQLLLSLLELKSPGAPTPPNPLPTHQTFSPTAHRGKQPSHPTWPLSVWHSNPVVTCLAQS